MSKRNENRRLVQPIHWKDNYPGTDSNGWQFILRPGAFFWTKGRLYVGYAWLSSLHHNEEPLWDPNPVEAGTIIETRGGFYQLTGVLREGKPYRRQYAQLQFAHLDRPDDFGSGFLKKQIDQGQLPIHEKYVLHPDTYLEAFWLGHFPLLNKSQRNGDNLERKIRRRPPLDKMRKVGRKVRESMEEQFSAVDDRQRMIEQFAVPKSALKVA